MGDEHRISNGTGAAKASESTDGAKASESTDGAKSVSPHERRVKESIEATSALSSHGELSPRRRLELLFDDGSFKELQQLTMQAPLPFGKQKRLPGDGVITAIGEVNGRPVAAVANVFNFMGGSIGVRTTKKIASSIVWQVKQVLLSSLLPSQREPVCKKASTSWKLAVSNGRQERVIRASFPK